MTPKLTKKELEDLKLILQETEYLTDKYSKLKNSKIPRNANMINLVTDMNCCNIDSFELFKTNKMNDLNYNKRRNKVYFDKVNNAFDDMLYEYINNVSYLERNELKEFIEMERKLTVNKTDDCFGEDEIENFGKTMTNVITDLDELLDEICIDLEKELNDDYWQHLIENRELAKCTETINLLDEEYKPDTEEFKESVSKHGKRKSTIVTRNVAKRQKEKERQYVDDDDTIEQEREFSKLNERFENVREQLQSHEDFMLKMFGRRSRMEILNFTKYREYQESDNLLALVIKLFKQPDKRKLKDSDLDYIFEQDKWLYWKLDGNGLLIENNILKCWDIHPITKERIKKIVVPFYLRGKLMDYAHHNVLQHHFSLQYTYRNLAKTFWWSSLYRDVTKFCKQCVSCQFVKGGPRKRAPLNQRQRPLPRQHLFADILGPIYQRYYILVLVDYATGYSMLIPMEGCDSLSIAQAIIDYWIRIFGCFEKLETDWGSGFTNKLLESLSKLLGYEHQIAEPRNHRSIGKVERVIGFLQSVINHYNILLGEELTDVEDIHGAWIRIRILLPFIQFAFNQRRMRITGISPNMGMFGTNLNDLTDVNRMTAKLDEFSKDSKLDKRDFALLRNIKDNIEKMNEISRNNWEKVTKLSVESYNSKYNITPEKIIKNKQNVKVDDEVLYFIGDKQVAMKKWRVKWSGPWLVDRKLNDSTIIITDPRNGNQKRVSIDRIKKYNKRNYIDYTNDFENNKEYIQYQEKLFNELSNYNVRTAGQDWKLDYNE